LADDHRGVLFAALLATAALSVPADVEGAPADRYNPIPPTTLTLAHKRMAPAQGGQRVHVTIPVAPGTNALGDNITYRWDAHVDGGPRCQPGALPDLSSVAAGAVIDAALPAPAKGWCRGSYGVRLQALVTVNCANDPPPYCRSGESAPQTVARAEFRVGSDPRRICHHRGDVERCWLGPTYRRPATWSVTAPLNDLLGPDGATEDADRYFIQAFRGDPALQRHWETADDSFWGYPHSRAEAVRMAAIVDRVLRAGPYHGKRWPGRPKRNPDTRP
jgi:hypothetical protein